MIATVTDYDVWHENDVNIETVISNAMKNEKQCERSSKRLSQGYHLTGIAYAQMHWQGQLSPASDKIPVETKRKLKDLIENNLYDISSNGR